MKLFPFRQAVTNPTVIVRKTRPGSEEPHFTAERLLGDFVLVHPKTPKEIYALQMLEHRVEKWAQKDGSGIVITKLASLKFS
jgi:hypothetical protein